MEDHARYRKLYPRIWKSLRGLTLEEKAIAIYLLTGDQTNRIGLYDFSIGKAIEDLETLPQTFMEGFNKILERLEWQYDKANRVLYIPTWWKWNLPENPNVLKGNLKDILEVAHSPLIYEFINNTQYLNHSSKLIEAFTQTLAERYTQPYPKPSPKQEQEQEEIPALTPEKKPPKTARSKKTRGENRILLPENFGISDRVRTWAGKKGFDHLDDHLEAFKRKASMNAYRYADWDAAFMEAIREDWAKLRGNGNGRGGQGPPAYRPPAPSLPLNPPGILIPEPDCPICGGKGVAAKKPCSCLHPESESRYGLPSQTATA